MRRGLAFAGVAVTMGPLALMNNRRQITNNPHRARPLSVNYDHILFWVVVFFFHWCFSHLATCSSPQNNQFCCLDQVGLHPMLMICISAQITGKYIQQCILMGGWNTQKLIFLCEYTELFSLLVKIMSLTCRMQTKKKKRKREKKLEKVTQFLKSDGMSPKMKSFFDLAVQQSCQMRTISSLGFGFLQK